MEFAWGKRSPEYESYIHSTFICLICVGILIFDNKQLDKPFSYLSLVAVLNVKLCNSQNHVGLFAVI
jgi:hypothetical protein